jgi:hypothetical protein
MKHTSTSPLPTARALPLWLATAALMLASAAHAAEAPASDAPPSDLTLVFGTKLWANQWSSWAAPSSGSGLNINPLNSGTSISVIPQLGLRYQRFIASMSMMARTSYTLDQAWQDSLQANRTELDANIGAYVVPGLAVTLGYKRLTQNFGGEFVWAGPTLGVSATGALTSHLSAYASVGLGALKATLGNPDGAGNSSLSANYTVNEAGLAYAPGESGASLLRKAAFTLGYRTQTVTTKGYVLTDSSRTPPTTTQNLRDTTQGLTLGMVLAF